MSRGTPDHAADADARERADLAAALIDQGFTAGASPERLLEALLAAYVAVAEVHPCCTAAGAAALQRYAFRLWRTAEFGSAASHLH
ncbi:hypothetical protein [Ottowia oryzae]|uniref:Uncharacterized protein n=1 Tax=Ottowia oryzae TaxID=2109914 RepID=A0A2S0MBC9_9BURK|nr:hypothetical protein [Ottowia oryzae]AVO33033.1 hypothetical protein C6570_01255 [Ottowia oryzae]AVO33672.1 hypothetical protein C6570_04930 [Ottowia oryzae]